MVWPKATFFSGVASEESIGVVGVEGSLDALCACDLYRLQELWKNSPHADQRPLSYILMLESDPAQEMVLQSRGVHPIVLESQDPGGTTLDFLLRISAAVASKSKQKRGARQHKR